jgi:hypothetical protein
MNASAEKLAENLVKVKNAGLLKYVDLEAMGVRRTRVEGKRDVFLG